MSLIMSKYNKELNTYNKFTPIWEERCNQAVLCIHSIGQASDIPASGIRDFGSQGEMWIRWWCSDVVAVFTPWEESSHVPTTLSAMKEFVHTIPSFSSHASQVLAFVTNDQDVVFNDCPAEIAQVRQIIESAADSEFSRLMLHQNAIPER